MATIAAKDVFGAVGRYEGSIEVRRSVVLTATDQFAIFSNPKTKVLEGRVAQIPLGPSLASIRGFEYPTVIRCVSDVAIIGVKNHFVAIRMQVVGITATEVVQGAHLAPPLRVLPLPYRDTAQPDVVLVRGRNGEE